MIRRLCLMLVDRGVLIVAGAVVLALWVVFGVAALPLLSRDERRGMRQAFVGRWRSWARMWVLAGRQ